MDNAPWLSSGERVLCTGRSSVVGPPWRGLALAVFVIVGGHIFFASALHLASEAELIATGVALLGFAAAAAVSIARSRKLDVYVVTTQRALIVRGEAVMREVPVSTPRLRFSEARRRVEWGPCRSSGRRAFAGQMGILDNVMIFDNVADIQSLSVTIRTARTTLGVDTPELS